MMDELKKAGYFKSDYQICSEESDDTMPHGRNDGAQCTICQATPGDD